MIPGELWVSEGGEGVVGVMGAVEGEGEAGGSLGLASVSSGGVIVAGVFGRGGEGLSRESSEDTGAVDGK